MSTPDGWDPADEEGLAPSEVVDLCKVLFAGKAIEIEAMGEGFVAAVDGEEWSPYGVLTELLQHLGKEGTR